MCPVTRLLSLGGHERSEREISRLSNVYVYSLLPVEIFQQQFGAREMCHALQTKLGSNFATPSFFVFESVVCNSLGCLWSAGLSDTSSCTVVLLVADVKCFIGHTKLVVNDACSLNLKGLFL